MPINRAIIDETLRTPYGEAAYSIVEKLEDSGFDALWVGGGVRDMLVGQIPHDIDITTSATPEQLPKIFPKVDSASAGLGSVRVALKKFRFEVTTFREDDEASDGRHPESIVFSTREKDARRRDFTINALYFSSISRELYDPCSGEADLREKLIRFIGEPAIRIKHDALRLLRAVRFRALLDGQYHPETYTALQELASMVESLSGTRMLEELQKMLLGPHPDRALEDLWELSMLKFMLPELYACKGIAQPADYHREGDVWEHMMQLMRAFRNEDGIDTRIASLFHDCGKVQTFSLKAHSTGSGQARIRFDHHATVSAQITRSALTRLQMVSKRVEKICWLITHHMMMGSFCDMNDARKAHWYYHPWFAELLQLFWLDIAGTTPQDFTLYDAIVTDYQHFLNQHPLPQKPLLTGDEVMEITGIKPGEQVGEILQSLHAAQLEKNITTKSEAKEFVKSAIPSRSQ